MDKQHRPLGAQPDSKIEILNQYEFVVTNIGTNYFFTRG